MPIAKSGGHFRGRGLAWQTVLFFGLLPGCASSGSGTPGHGDPGAAGAPAQVSLEPTAAATEELRRLQAELATSAALDAPGFAEKTAVPFGALGKYDPLAATGMDSVQKSAFALSKQEQSALSDNGFVVSGSTAFPSFMYGYASIYAQDLPLYVSADSILYAVHQSYDSMLQSVESGALSVELASLLDGMHARLGKAGLAAPLTADADVYLSTARSLLAGVAVAPLDADNAAEAKRLTQLATQASGTAQISVFGLKRGVDFSQFLPRGHYTASDELQRYFRAMTWLGRVDLRLIDTQADGSVVFQRNQLEGAVALRALMDAPGRASWKLIDDAITAFVGEHDDMTPAQVDGLLSSVGATDVASLGALSDHALAQAIVDGGFGVQRIASQLAINGLNLGTLPLARSFAFLGQRFVLDSQVFSNVVYDRVHHEGAPLRMMPNPLDVAYAALGNDQAGMLLAPEVSQYQYAPDLYGMRLIADEHDAEFWHGNLYNLWLSALRTLSPSAGVAKPASVGLPSVTGTDAWGRRLLDTQLASWSELRHDTLLYAKPSYTEGAACEFPAAYVDPYPEFYAALVAFAEHGLALSEALGPKGGVDWYFTRLAETAGTLRDIALDQRQGLPLSAEHLAFINQAVTFARNCDGSKLPVGWYSQLFYDQKKAVEADPTIADVHTQPTDEGGAEVGRVLHVGTGTPRLMVVTVDSCTGAQAYVGLTSSYYERITEQYERLTDEQWTTILGSDAPERPAWLPSAFVP